MKRIPVIQAAVLFSLALLLIPVTVSAQPSSISYQGELIKNGAPYTGSATFKFVLVGQGGISLWSSDGSSTNGSEPSASSTLDVSQGLFSVRLGETPMVPITADALQAATSVGLRVWVNTGQGFELLPDQPLASSPFALHSETSERSLGGFTANGIIHSQQGGIRFPDGSLQTTASIGAGGGGTLDQAYDFGGPGAGRTITADAGAVNVIGPDGLRVLGSITVGTSSIPRGRIAVQGIGASDTTKILAFDEAEGGEFFFESGFAGTGSAGNSLKLGTAWTPLSMLWRGDGKIGIGTASPTGRLTIEHNGTGTADAALRLRATNTGASIALFAESAGSDATTIASNTGTGDIFRGFNGGANPVFRVDNAGKAVASGLQVTSGPTQLDSSGRWRLAGAYGNGVAGAPVYSENTSSGGVAFWGKATGTDGAMILEQNGTGPLVRAFRSGQLRFEVQNSGRVVTTALQITGGGDLAEPFDVVQDERVAPGSVLVIDDAHPGRLKLSDRPYDARVAGVVSGAGGIRPGIVMTPDESHRGPQVALIGRVYAKADASGEEIRPGDLLTTSSVPGHLMKASDSERARGAVIGKAMSGLTTGRGMVLVLVSLQ